MGSCALILVISVVFACTGCSSGNSGESAATPARYTEPPWPAKATVAPPMPAATAPVRTCGDPTRSLRPAGKADGPNLAAIRARGRLVVGLDTGSNLFSFRDTITGAIQGFDADMAREIARDLFGDPERVEYRVLGSADRENALLRRTVDVVVKTMSITCERRQRVSFSTGYFQTSQRILVVRSGVAGANVDVPVIRDTAGLAGRRVCVVSGTTSLQHIRERQPAAVIVTVTSWADCLVVLQQRQADAISTDDAILAGLAAQDPNLEIVGPALSNETYGIGISRDSPDVVRFVNGVLERVRADGSWYRSYARWLAPVLGSGDGPPAPRYED